jgi:ABC-2 type transport system permease protein
VREALALIRAAWLGALSYRLQMMFQVLGLVGSIVPLYFISRALQPIMADAIRLEGGQYFAFLVVGLVTYMLVSISVMGLHGALAGEISTGALEAMLATPVRIWSIIVGEMGQGFSLTCVRAIVLLTAAWVLGAQILWDRVFVAALIVGLIVATYIPLGILAGALVLAFRTTGPFPTLVLGLSSLLGGVYYPTTVVPSWLAKISSFVPLTYGLRALRRCVIEGAPLVTLLPDIGMVVLFAVGLGTVAYLAFRWALQHARWAGTLAQY